eukprot:466127_1
MFKLHFRFCLISPYNFGQTMVRKFELLLPISAGQTNIIRNQLQMNQNVHYLTERKDTNEKGAECIVFTFKVGNEKSQQIVDLLTLYEFSGSFDIIPLMSSTPQIDAEQQSKLTLDEIYYSIRENQISLTFEYLASLVVGSIVSVFGLLRNSFVLILASLFISNLTGPILGMTIASALKDKVMFWKSFRNELIGIMLCFVTSVLMGFIFSFMIDPLNQQLVYGNNTEMQSRAELTAAYWGIAVAVPSGVALAITTTSNYELSTLISVAISGVFLPLIVNSGLTLSSALIIWINPKYSDTIASTWVEAGYNSIILFIVNWIFIYIAGVFTFWLKRLTQSTNDPEREKQLNDFHKMQEMLKNEMENTI